MKALALLNTKHACPNCNKDWAEYLEIVRVWNRNLRYENKKLRAKLSQNTLEVESNG